MRIQKTAVSNNNDYEKMPVLFCIFNKLETTPKVFNAIRKSRPKRLYISSDGAREEKEGEKKKVEALREFILKNIDWDCEVFTKFSEKNLACKEAMNSAIDWFFENEEMGIILEDDTLPAPSFFRFCSELLQKYKNEEKVYLISGYYGNAKKSSSNKYFFKQEPNTWGWATWRRAWKRHDKTLSQFEIYQKQNESEYVKIDEVCDFSERMKILHEKFLLGQMEAIKYRNFCTWDYQWLFTIVNNNGLCILPDCNLITNIGVGVADNTHTDFEYQKDAMLPTGEFLFPMEHQTEIKVKFNIEDFIKLCIQEVSFCSFQSTEYSIIHQICGAGKLLGGLSISDVNVKKSIEQLMNRDFLIKMIESAINSGNYPKAQKYLYLALNKSLLQGKNNFCAKCQKQECLSACSTKSISPYKTENDEFAVKINRQNCEFCWNCMKNCPAVNPK